MYKTIEAKLNAQNEELMQRAKVIEELKTSLSIFIDKYNKLKVDLEKERQYGIQISLGLKNSQRAKKKGKGFPPLRITHFSSYYPRCVVRKKTATNPKSEVELKELKEKFEKFKSEKNKNENEWNLNLNKLKGELDESQKKLLSCQEELSHERKDKDKTNDIIKGYLSSIETLKEEKNKKTNEISQLNDKMKEILNEKTKICEQIQSLKKESESWKTNEDNYKKTIQKQKEEISQLKADSIVNFQKSKKENDELMFQLSKMNDKLVEINNTHKQAKNVKPSVILKPENKVSIFLVSNKPTNTKKYDDTIIQLKNDLTSMTKKNNELTDSITKIKIMMKDKDKKHKNNVTELKNSIVNMYEKYNVLLLNLEKTTSNKLDKMKEKITHVKKSLSVIPNKAGKNEKAMKIIISKLENEKEKLLTRISNTDISIKEKDKRLTNYEKILKQKDELIAKYENELKTKSCNYSELEAMNKELCQKLEMYIIENSGKSKVIEERNEEIKKLKKMIPK